MAESSQKVAEKNDAVPLFGTWRNAYVAIVVIFVLQVSLFYFVSRYFL